MLLIFSLVNMWRWDRIVNSGVRLHEKKNKVIRVSFLLCNRRLLLTIHMFTREKTCICVHMYLRLQAPLEQNKVNWWIMNLWKCKDFYYCTGFTFNEFFRNQYNTFNSHFVKYTYLRRTAVITPSIYFLIYLHNER